MFGIGMPELLIIMVVALLVIGPKKLPDLAKSLGKGMSEFRKATDEIKGSLAENEAVQDLQKIKKDFSETVDSMKVDNVLDVDNVLEPKEPKPDLEGRKALMDELDQETPAGDAPESTDQIQPDAQDATETTSDTPDKTAAEKPGGDPPKADG